VQQLWCNGVMNIGFVQITLARQETKLNLYFNMPQRIKSCLSVHTLVALMSIDRERTISNQFSLKMTKV